MVGGFGPTLTLAPSPPSASRAQRSGCGGGPRPRRGQRHLEPLWPCTAHLAHGAVHWDNATTPTGRYLLGIETGDPLIDKHNEFLDE